ncbi:endonuclease/exonuclease/phosphatase family protein [Actinoplanes sp. DH11]|uniref:endonuclease/exonuclease/phosphatase family protein n=1 Tax=Actinoplanes sp. DH11 TaxID=2857011 RepID=UPI001E3F0EA7|nr:endonuclease/exonuclease/phosphatase family protein [Actinoplanes sp. DH11]
MTITDAPAETRPAHHRRRIPRTVLTWLLVTPAAIWFLVRAFGFEQGRGVQLIAFTPYVAAWALIPALLALIVRRWAAAAVAVLTAFGLAMCVLPRALPDVGRGPAQGVEVRVMTANLLFGGADPDAVVRLVRDNDVAILAFQELTEPAQAALTAAGLDRLLPHREVGAEPGASGSGLYSRYPITDAGTERTGAGFLQSHATVRVPGATPVLVESAHPLAPAVPASIPGWSSDLRQEPPADPDGLPRILLGDFNATLDHKLLRNLIKTGYRDAAATLGSGLIGTWGPYDGDLIPPVTIDHVLADERIGIQDLSVHDVTGSDHRAVIAALTLPEQS